MNKYFSYFRVSSKNQGETGASLEAQMLANAQFAQENQFEIVKEFREVQSAGKGGRKQFTAMVAEIRKRSDIAGIIFHDVDRSSRNFSDWATIESLVNNGYKIYFSRDKSGLGTRGEKLTAGIKAVIAKDFLENLSQETKKGLYRRLEQGLMPFGQVQPGYIPKGGGVREIDPTEGPLIKKCFELYATGKYSLLDLAEIMYGKGLRTKAGTKVNFTKMSLILNNEFYIGIMTVNGKKYPGIHKPLITKALFDKVQKLLQRRYSHKEKTYKYKFQRIVICSSCNRLLRSMTAKKRFTYYVCRHRDCLAYGKTLAEPKLEAFFVQQLAQVRFSKEDTEAMVAFAKQSKASIVLAMSDKSKSIELQIAKLQTQQNRLVDIYIGNEVSKDVYEIKHQEIKQELDRLTEELNTCNNPDMARIKSLERLAELLANPAQAFKVANSENKSNLIQKMMINVTFSPNGLNFEWQTPILRLLQIKNDPRNGGRLTMGD